MNELRKIIMEHPFFYGMDAKHLEAVAEAASMVKFNAGATLFQEGEPADRLFLITHGSVALEAHDLADGTVPVQELEAGSVLGWSWLFPPFAWHLQARAIEPTEAVAVNGGHLLATAERDPKFGYDLMKRVARVVIQRLQATRKRLSLAEPRLN